jgi:SAM-dependent methyltransferase
MGFLKEKYTIEYFTGRDASGRRIKDFGVLGVDEWETGGLYADIKDAIDSVETRGRRILEIGFGRGESARYLLSAKKAEYYCGVDFSESALELARMTLSLMSQTRWKLAHADALVWLEQESFVSAFDVVFMLDAIEHIPAVEVGRILPFLYRALTPNGFLVIHTPLYGIDEDFISQGFSYIAPTPSDINPATRGMHCNKYTKQRLLSECMQVGFGARSPYVYKKCKIPHIYTRFWELVSPNRKF